MFDSCSELEEMLVALHGSLRSDRHQVDKDIRLEAANFQGKSQKFPRVSGADAITHVAVNEIGSFQQRCSCGGLHVDGEIREQDALGIGKLPCNEVKTRQGNNRIPQASDPIDKYFPYGGL